MLGPFRPVTLTKVATKRLFTPWTIAWVRNGSKSGHRLVFARIFQELLPRSELLHVKLSAGLPTPELPYQSQSSVAAHTMSGYADSR